MKTRVDYLKALLQDREGMRKQYRKLAAPLKRDIEDFVVLLREEYSDQEFAEGIAVAYWYENRELRKRLDVLERWEASITSTTKENPVEALVSVAIHLLKQYKNKISPISREIAADMNNEVEALKYVYRRFQAKRGNHDEPGD